MSRHLISVKLGRADNMPTRHMRKLLDQASADVCLAKNRMVETWMAASRTATEDKFQWNKSFYHAARAVAPELNSKIISACMKHVRESLTTKIAWNSESRLGYRWKAVLAYEQRAPWWRNGIIPVQCQDARISYQGMPNRKGGFKVRDLESAKHNALFRLPLLSHNSGARDLGIVCLLRIGDLSKGHREIIRKICDPGESTWLMKDSLLVHKDNDWILRLNYALPDQVLDSDRVLTVKPNSVDAGNVLRMFYPDGGWRDFGDGNLYVAEFHRLGDRKKILNRKQRIRPPGHGKQRIYDDRRPITRRQQHITDSVIKNIVSDIHRAAVKHDCGAVLYREPSLGLRKFDWFAKRRVTFPWDDFRSRLQAKLDLSGIKLDCKRVKKAEWEEWNTPAEESTPEHVSA